jgi:hypothetical protein
MGELRERGIPAPRAMGISHQLAGFDERADRAKLAALLDA